MTVWYADFGQTYNGNGSAYTAASGTGLAGALNTLVGASFLSGDTVWIRRSATSLALAASYTPSLAGVKLIGWPISGDANYATRPSSPQSTWDADAATYAKISIGTATYLFAPTGTAFEMHRIWIDVTTAAGSTNIPLTLTGANNVVENCKVGYSTSTAGTAVDLRCASITGTTPSINGLVCIGSSVGATASSAIVSINSGASDGLVQNLNITAQYCNRGTSSNSTAGALVLQNTAGNKSLVVDAVTITYAGALSQHQGSAVILAAGSVHLLDCTVAAQTGTA